MARSKLVVDRLKTELADNPKVPHYESRLGESYWPLQPDDIKTAGYWKKERRRVPNGVEPVAYVISGQGGSLHGTVLLTRWMPSYHLNQTVPMKSRGENG